MIIFSMFRNALIFLVVVCSVGWATNPSSPPLRERILKGVELTILGDFENAKVLYQDLIEEYPEEPVGYFYSAAVLQSQMLDEEDYSPKGQFDKLLEMSIEKSRQLQKARPDDPWLRFYEGNSYLYRSFLKSKLGDWWGAYRDAGKGANRLKKALEIDSTLYDAYLGIGSYKYWKSSKIKFLRWLPFVSDERQTGIRMVEKSVEKGIFVELIARDQLAWIMLDAGRFDDARQYALKNYQQYPKSRFFLWTLVEVLYRAGDWDEAYRKYQLLLPAVRQIPNNNHYNEIECLLKMAEIDFKRGNTIRADSLVTQIFDIKLEPEIRQRARPKLERALEVRLKYADAADGLP